MMFARFGVYAERAPTPQMRDLPSREGAEPDPSRIRPRIGSAFEHTDSSIAVYLDALPVTGRLLLVPEDDLRAKPVRRGAL